MAELAAVIIALILALALVAWMVLNRPNAGHASDGVEVGLRLAQERFDQQSARVLELEREVEQLQKQLEWNMRLIESQDRVIQQLGGSTSPPAMESEAGDAPSVSA